MAEKLVVKCAICAKNGEASDVDVFDEPLFHCRHDQTPCTQCPLITMAACSNCHTYLSFLQDGQWHDFDDYLHCKEETRQGLRTVESFQDRVRLFILSQVHHNQRDLDPDEGQSPYTLYSSSESAELLWRDGHAIGFITVKHKGKPIGGNPWECYTMPVIDTLYIRKSCRCRGYGRQIVLDTMNRWMGSHVGFSYPVSLGLLKVLKEILVKNPHWRDYLWLTTYTGGEGYRENVWFSLHTL